MKTSIIITRWNITPIKMNLPNIQCIGANSYCYGLCSIWSRCKQSKIRKYCRRKKRSGIHICETNSNTIIPKGDIFLKIFTKPRYFKMIFHTHQNAYYAYQWKKHNKIPNDATKTFFTKYDFENLSTEALYELITERAGYDYAKVVLILGIYIF